MAALGLGEMIRQRWEETSAIRRAKALATRVRERVTDAKKSLWKKDTDTEAGNWTLRLRNRKPGLFWTTQDEDEYNRVPTDIEAFKADGNTSAEAGLTTLFQDLTRLRDLAIHMGDRNWDIAIAAARRGEIIDPGPRRSHGRGGPTDPYPFVTEAEANEAWDAQVKPIAEAAVRTIPLRIANAQRSARDARQRAEEATTLNLSYKDIYRTFASTANRTYEIDRLQWILAEAENDATTFDRTNVIASARVLIEMNTDVETTSNKVTDTVWPCAFAAERNSAASMREAEAYTAVATAWQVALKAWQAALDAKAPTLYELVPLALNASDDAKAAEPIIQSRVVVSRQAANEYARAALPCRDIGRYTRNATIAREKLAEAMGSSTGFRVLPERFIEQELDRIEESRKRYAADEARLTQYLREQAQALVAAQREAEEEDIRTRAQAAAQEEQRIQERELDARQVVQAPVQVERQRVAVPDRPVAPVRDTAERARLAEVQRASVATAQVDPAINAGIAKIIGLPIRTESARDSWEHAYIANRDSILQGLSVLQFTKGRPSSEFRTIVRTGLDRLDDRTFQSAKTRGLFTGALTTSGQIDLDLLYAKFRDCHVVIQGGEAVNRYTGRDVVQTHDTDCRVITPGFDNFTEISDRDSPGKTGPVNTSLWLAYVLVITFVLESQVRGWRICAPNGVLFYEFLNDMRYTNADLAQRLYCLMSAYRGSLIPIVDLFAPRQMEGGWEKTPELWGYFRGAELKPQIPEIRDRIADTPVQWRQSSVGLGVGRQVNVASLGYILWDTLRMLLASPPFQSNNKTAKYKQKLAGLLGALLDEDISKEMLKLSRDTSRDPVFQGGAKTDSGVPDGPDGPDPMTPEFLAAARTASTAFQSGTLSRNTTTTLTDEEEAGLLDAMSQTNQDFRDYRLPLTQEELAWKYRDEEDTPQTAGSRRTTTYRRRRSSLPRRKAPSSGHSRHYSRRRPTSRS